MTLALERESTMKYTAALQRGPGERGQGDELGRHRASPAGDPGVDVSAMSPEQLRLLAAQLVAALGNLA